MNETVKQQSGARILNAAAQLAQGKMLSPLFTICETQHQVGTQKLERYLEEVGNRLKDCAFEIRMGYDALTTRLAESERRVAELEARQSEQPEPADGVEVVATALLGGLFHGGSGPELGDIDIQLNMPALESLQARIVGSSDDVAVDLITLAAHQAEVARLRAQLERWLELDKQRDAERDTLHTQLDRANALLREWRRMFDGGIADGTLGILRGQTDAHLAQQPKP